MIASMRGPAALVDPRRHQRAAAAHALGIGAGIVLADAGLRQRADQAASGAAGRRHCGGRGEPAGCDNRTDPRDGEHSEAGEQTRRAAERRADAGTLAGALGTVIDAVGVAVDLLDPSRSNRPLSLFEMMLMSLCGTPERSSSETTRAPVS